MASEHERLVVDLAELLVKLGRKGVTHPVDKSTAVLAFIAERTKEATEEMIKAWQKRSCQPLEPELDWFAMHAASALWPARAPADGER